MYEDKLRQIIRELIEDELEEMTGTGAVDGFGTPFAFQGDSEANKKKRKASATAVDGYEIVGENEYEFGDGYDGRVPLEKYLKIMSSLPPNGETRAYKTVNGQTRWAARNKSGVLKDFPSKMAAAKFRLTEGGDPYYAWRNDEEKSPRAKIGEAISEMNNQLREMERTVKRCRRLRNETNLATSDYWKRTNNALMKMESRMHNIAKMVREMRG